MADLFGIVGEGFFKPLTSQYKTVYFDCMTIIYNTYRSELSYGAEREVLVGKLTEYFDNSGISDIQFEDEPETLRDSRAKATEFLRKLKSYGWIEYEISNNQTQRIIMPDYSVTLIQTFINIASNNEIEYQGEISAIYSLLTSKERLDPYPQIIKPVHDRTLALFTGLKKLNTGIRKYIDRLTAEKTSEEIIHDFFEYNDEIGSKAYHRIKTSENISRFRNAIISGLQNIRSNPTVFDNTVSGYQIIENESDRDCAAEQVRHLISDMIDSFRSYDDIVDEIDKKHRKYLYNAVERAKFLLLNTNNMEGRLSNVLQYLAECFNRDEQKNMSEDASDEICSLFNMFPQGFLSGESLKSIPISKKITELDDIYVPIMLSDEEREKRRDAEYAKNKNRFSKKNITAFVQNLLSGKESIMASEIPVKTRRDMIRLIFIDLYGRADKCAYIIIPSDCVINNNGLCFHDFQIKRRIR